MYHGCETCVYNLHVCEVYDMLQMKVDEDSILTHEDPHIENVNDGHVKGDIASFYSRNNLEQVPLIHELSLV